MSVRAPDGPAAKNAGASAGRHPQRIGTPEGRSVLKTGTPRELASRKARASAAATATV